MDKMHGSLNAKITGFMLTAACAICLATGARADLLIELSPSPMVIGPEILLREIAANPAVLPEGWGERTVMRAPEPGRRAEHSLLSIAYALQQYPDMNEVLLHGQRSITVRRSGTGIGSEKIIKAIKDFIRNDDRWSDAAIDIQCEPIEEYVHIPPGSNVKIDVKNCTPQRETNRFLLETAILEPGGTVNQIVRVFARITPMTEVWAASRAMRSGESPGADDIVPQFVPADTSEGYIPTSETVEGMELIRAVGSNQPFNRRFLVAPICARRGDTIDVTATSGALTITARATALATGRRGDYILCVNENSNRRLRVRLIGTKRAIIDLGESG